SILLRVGDNVTVDPNAQILAGKNIDIYGDFARTAGANLDTTIPDDSPKFGTVMHLHGVIAHGPTASGYLTRTFGNADTDQFFFDQTFLGGTSGSATSVMPGGTGQSITPKFAEYSSILSSYSGGKTRAYGSNLV